MPDNDRPTNEKAHASRAYTRIPRGVTLELRKLEYPLPDTVGEKGTTRNIAQTGICFVTPTEYHPGDLLSIAMTLNGWHRDRKGLSAILNDDLSKSDVLSVVAEVIWSRQSRSSGGYDIGVKFTNVYEDDMIALQKYFSRMLPED